MPPWQSPESAADRASPPFNTMSSAIKGIVAGARERSDTRAIRNKLAPDMSEMPLINS